MGATRPNMGLSAPPISLTWAIQQRYPANMGLSAALLSPNMGLSAALLSITWAYQHSLTD